MVIVPARNEAATIADVVRDIRNALPQSVVLVIDDHSSDATSELACAAGAQVLTPGVGKGLAACLQTGYEHAFRAGCDFAVRVDGDGQHEEADIPVVLEGLLLSGADLAIGSRYIEKTAWRTSLMRSLGTAVLRWAATPALGKVVHDPTSGFIAVNRKVMAMLASSQPPAYPEIGALIRLARRECRLHEVPCRMYARRNGRSSMTFANCVRYSAIFLRELIGARG